MVNNTKSSVYPLKLRRGHVELDNVPRKTYQPSFHLQCPSQKRNNGPSELGIP